MTCTQCDLLPVTCQLTTFVNLGENDVLANCWPDSMSLKLIDHFVYLITLAADYMSPIAYFKKAIGHSLFESIAPESTIFYFS